MSKIRSIACLIMLLPTLAAFGTEPRTGKDIYRKKCQRCHGGTGGKGLSGAKDLRMSRMKYGDVLSLIATGQKPMPAFKAKLTAEEMALVANYAISLRSY